MDEVADDRIFRKYENQNDMGPSPIAGEAGYLSGRFTVFAYLKTEQREVHMAF